MAAYFSGGRGAVDKRGPEGFQAHEMVTVDMAEETGQRCRPLRVLAEAVDYEPVSQISPFSQLTMLELSLLIYGNSAGSISQQLRSEQRVRRGQTFDDAVERRHFGDVAAVSPRCFYPCIFMMLLYTRVWFLWLEVAAWRSLFWFSFTPSHDASTSELL
ncbi:hypothetical protein TRV_07973 [Trichophyton verrucosum HKI 0517]|uniref:Uncharacterized protein n=1 Tax=Trichophyton verrucosum (strain HKI 0517) TaxID=663202 RepID=D4DL99_TRIVH|nr:uncharacterized protein TRV_07973 [Trichophyton verrucosum HKI 0517]EFE37376.1 hypothetical protein TRV_07973 [Trichophyton verrucosum HKI 0517]